MWNLAKDLTSRLLHSLSFKLSFSAGLIVFIAVAVAAYLNLEQQKSNLEHRIETEAEGYIETVRRATYWSMLNNQRESQFRIIRDMGAQPGIERIRVFNKEGKVMFSSRQEDIGRLVDMDAEACYGCHATDKPLERLPNNERTRVFKDTKNERVLSTILPIYNEPACSGPPCHFHPAKQKVLGVLDVTMDLADVDRTLARQRTLTLAFAVLLFLGLSTLIGMAVILTVNRTVNRLVTEADKVAAGDHNQVERIMAPDDLGRLALAFNDMAQKVAMADRAKEARYSQLVLNSTDAVLVMERDGSLVLYNPLVGRILSLTSEDLDGMRFQEVVQEQDRASFQQALEEAATLRGPSRMVSFKVYSGPAGQRVLEGRFRAIEDDKGRVRILGNLRDVTERQAMEAELDRRRAFEQGLINQALNAIIATDAAGRIQIFNQRAADLLGMSMETALGKNYKDFFPRAQVRLMQKAIFDKPRQGAELVRPAVVKTAEGKRLPVQMSAFSLFIGHSFSGAVMFLINTRESKRLKAQLLKNTRLAAVGQTMASLAHYIKNLLHGLGTASYLVDQGFKDGDLELSQQGWRMIKRNLDQLEGLTQDLLAYAKDRRPQYQVFDLNRLLAEVAALVAGKAGEIGAVVETQEDPGCTRVMLDPLGIRRVVLNLVTNALDALASAPPKEGAPRVVLSCGRDGHGQVMISVSDNGPGLTPEARRHLFHGMFSTKGSKGTGLGLLVSLKIVEEHGGAMDVHSKAGEGTRFTLGIPDISQIGQEGAVPDASAPDEAEVVPEESGGAPSA